MYLKITTMNKNAYIKALSHLKADERQALVLVKSNGKSSWEAGEIIEKAHYKFLEILSRGKRFVELFATHYTVYDQLIPDEITISPTIKTYLNLVMGSKRVKPSDARAQMNDDFFKKGANQAKLFEFEFKKWEYSKNTHELYFLYLVKEFDKWNNYRILPIELQEPHAFPRRNKRRYEYMLTSGWKKNSQQIDDYKDTYIAHGNTPDRNLLYFVLFEDFKRGLYHIVKVNKNEINLVEELSRKRHYLFAHADLKTLENIVFSCLTFFAIDYRTPNQGLKFWNEFRSLIVKAYNYKACEGLDRDMKSLVVKKGNKNLSFKTH